MSSLTVQEPHHVPVIDTMNRLGIAVVRVGDVISLIFKDREFMRTVGNEMVNCDDSNIKITISGLQAKSDHKVTCDMIADSLFQPVGVHDSTGTASGKPKPPKPPKPPRPPRPPKSEAELPKPVKSTPTLSEMLVAIKNQLAVKSQAKAIFKNAIAPHIQKGATIYYKKRDTYAPKDVVICKIQGSIVAACKIIKPGLRGHYLVELDGKEVYTKQVYGKITFKKNPKKVKKND